VEKTNSRIFPPRSSRITLGCRKSTKATIHPPTRRLPQHNGNRSPNGARATPPQAGTGKKVRRFIELNGNRATRPAIYSTALTTTLPPFPRHRPLSRLNGDTPTTGSLNRKVPTSARDRGSGPITSAKRASTSTSRASVLARRFGEIPDPARVHHRRRYATARPSPPVDPNTTSSGPRAASLPTGKACPFGVSGVLQVSPVGRTYTSPTSIPTNGLPTPLLHPTLPGARSCKMRAVCPDSCSGTEWGLPAHVRSLETKMSSGCPIPVPCGPLARTYKMGHPPVPGITMVMFRLLRWRLGCQRSVEGARDSLFFSHVSPSGPSLCSGTLEKGKEGIEMERRWQPSAPPMAAAGAPPNCAGSPTTPG